MRGLALNFASTHQTENPRGFSEVGENQQLLIAIVVLSFYFVSYQSFWSKYLSNSLSFILNKIFEKLLDSEIPFSFRKSVIE
ncbi:hypothetical protein DIS07_14860 [Polaribacter aquimarinus]|uniref:Uncharacterized protein n=1 Tax=Polaribacter aquimarinus TaxID=2100726 RepID=A0A2U2J6S3_9FLAO|nr:hypothetical protein DIS07_14860 [Polaribacter aquimarinus]